MGQQTGRNSFIKNKCSITSLLLLLIVCLPASLIAQNDQTLEFDLDSDPGAQETGPSLTFTDYVFIHNYNNPDDNVFTPYLPQTTVNFTITNNFDSGQSYFVSQNTNNDSGDPNNPPVVFGWSFIAPGTGFIRDGASRDIGNPISSLATSLPPFNSSSVDTGPSNAYFTSGSTAGQGIDVNSNHGIRIVGGFDGLDGQPYRNNRYRMATLQIDFSAPMDNPILHIHGMGGFWNVTQTESDGSGDGTGTITFENTATLDFELVNVNGGGTGGVTLSKLSGTTHFNVDNSTKVISNDATIPNLAFDNGSYQGETVGVGNGSALVTGNDISSLTFNIFVSTIQLANQLTETNTGSEDYYVLGANEFGWAGGGTFDGAAAFPGSGLSNAIAVNSINFASDATILSISQSVQPDDMILTEAECYRMLSSPVTAYTITSGTTDDTSERPLTYAELLDPLWTQGMTGADYTGGDANVWLWPDVSGESSGSWQDHPNLNNQIDAGSGFLISVYEDDEFGTPGSFNKTISVTGSENPPVLFTNMNSNAEGWTLLGNPFKSTIDWDNVFGEANTNEVQDAVYVYDRSTSSYVSWSGGAGDLTGGLIAPFQGFFVQNVASGGFTNSAQVDFTNNVKSASSGTFYGKEDELRNFVRFEVNGEDLYNSMWVRFSDAGSLERTRGDALELMPMSSEYAMLGTRKGDDGTIFDIGHYPIPSEAVEIPVSLETTRPGNFTLTATDLDLSFGADLYLIDLIKEKSIRIDENFSYEFSTDAVAKTPGGDPFNRCTVNGPQKAKTFASSDRFLISTQPKDFVEIPSAIALNQNYPNPFNPTTQISYDLPQQSDVRLEVYDLVGRQVATLVNQTMEAGSHTVNFDATNLSSGVYIYRLNAGNTVLSRKLTVIK